GGEGGEGAGRGGGVPGAGGGPPPAPAPGRPPGWRAAGTPPPARAKQPWSPPLASQLSLTPLKQISGWGRTSPTQAPNAPPMHVRVPPWHGPTPLVPGGPS